MSAKSRRAQAAIVLDGTDHGSKRVHMACKHKRLALAAQAHKHVAFCRTFGRKAHLLESLHYIIGHRACKSRRTRDGSEGFELLSDVIERVGHFLSLGSMP